MKNSSRLILAAIVAIVVFMSAPTSAATITLRTGVDGSLAVLGENVTDPFWTISVQSGPFVAAEVVNSEVECCGMETVGSQAAWISDPSVEDGSAETNWGMGLTAIARRSFDLTGLDASTAVLSGIWRVADGRQGIYLNNLLFDPATADGGAGWVADQSFTTAIGFLSGVNVLELRGVSGNSTWDGFWLDATVEARAINEVPEPATLGLFALGLAGLRAARKRRHS